MIFQRAKETENINFFPDGGRTLRKLEEKDLPYA